MISSETPPHASLEKFSVLPLPFCGWAYVEKEKGFLACLPPLLLKRQESLVAKSGVSCYPAAHGFHRSQPGGFLPIFSDVPRADTHAVEDIGAVVDWLTEPCDFRADAKSSLAVLHNRNDMTNLFRASNWVSGSQDSIVSRGVTTCAGMTAHTVILAQTRVGFLTGGRKKVLSSST